MSDTVTVIWQEIPERRAHVLHHRGIHEIDDEFKSVRTACGKSLRWPVMAARDVLPDGHPACRGAGCFDVLYPLPAEHTTGMTLRPEAP